MAKASAVALKPGTPGLRPCRAAAGEDLREAPRTWGPLTQDALQRSLSAWEAATKPIVMVASSDPRQFLHLRLLIKDLAPKFGHVVTELDAIDVFVD